MGVARLGGGVAVGRGEPLIGGLDPRVPGIEREVVARQADPEVEGAERERARPCRRGRLLRARLRVDQVVRARGEDVRMDRVDGERGLVRRILGMGSRRAADADESACCGGGRRDNSQRGGD